MQKENTIPLPRAFFYLCTLIVGYIGVYLCRKNLSVALPLMQQEFGITKAKAGIVVSASTLAYAYGKLICGPIVDRLGGRASFLWALLLVCLFGAVGGAASSIMMLTITYSANRFSGSGAWGAMVKLVPDWFPKSKLASALSWLCLSYVVGGALAAFFAAQVLSWFGSWRAVMSVPSVVLLFVLVLCWFVLPRAKPEPKQESGACPAAQTPWNLKAILSLFKSRHFLIVCCLSFTLTLVRETFNAWTVDYLYKQGGGNLGRAANWSSVFDLAGGLGILAIGHLYDHITGARRKWALAGILAAAAVVLATIAVAPLRGVVTAAVLVGVTGFLIYGPYSLLSGVMAVEVEGKGRAATVACLVDATGYFAGVLAGAGFGAIVDKGGYSLGFSMLSFLMLVSAGVCLLLRWDDPKPATA